MGEKGRFWCKIPRVHSLFRWHLYHNNFFRQLGVNRLCIAHFYHGMSSADVQYSEHYNTPFSGKAVCPIMITQRHYSSSVTDFKQDRNVSTA